MFFYDKDFCNAGQLGVEKMNAFLQRDVIDRVAGGLFALCCDLTLYIMAIYVDDRFVPDSRL